MHQKIFTKAIQTTFSYLMEHKCEDDSNKLLLLNTHTQLSLSYTHTLNPSLSILHTQSHTDTETHRRTYTTLFLCLSHTHTLTKYPHFQNTHSLSFYFLKKKRKGKRRTSVDACGTVFHIHNKARRFCPCVRRLRAIIPFLALKILPFFKQKARYFKSPNKQHCYEAQMRKMCFDNHSLELFLLCRLFSFENSHLDSV